MEDSHNYVQILIDTLRKQTDVLKDVLEVTKEQSVIAGKKILMKLCRRNL